jgi:hypothetical protein
VARGLPWTAAAAYTGRAVKWQGRQEVQPAGPKFRALGLALASGAPPCLAGQRDGKFPSEKDRGHDNYLTLPGWTMFGIVDGSLGLIRMRHGLLHGPDELVTPAPRARARGGEGGELGAGQEPLPSKSGWGLGARLAA